MQQHLCALRTRWVRAIGVLPLAVGLLFMLTQPSVVVASMHESLRESLKAPSRSHLTSASQNAVTGRVATLQLSAPQFGSEPSSLASSLTSPLAKTQIAQGGIISTVESVFNYIVNATVFFPAQTFQDAVEKASRNIFTGQMEQIRGPLGEVLNVFAFTNSAVFGNIPIPGEVNEIGRTLTRAAVPLWGLSLVLLGLAALTRSAVGMGYGTNEVTSELARWLFIALASGNAVAIVSLVHSGFGALATAIVSSAGRVTADEFVDAFMPRMGLDAWPILLLVIGAIIGFVTIVVLAITYVARFTMMMAITGLAPIAIACEGIPFTRFVFRDWLSMFLRMEFLQIINVTILVIFKTLGFMVMMPSGSITRAIFLMVVMIGLSSAIISVNIAIFKQVFGVAMDVVAQMKAASEQFVRTITQVAGVVAGAALTAASGGAAAPALAAGGTALTAGSGGGGSSSSAGTIPAGSEASSNSADLVAAAASASAASASAGSYARALSDLPGPAGAFMRGFAGGAAASNDLSRRQAATARVQDQQRTSETRRAESLAREMGATDTSDIDAIGKSITNPKDGHTREEMTSAHRDNADLLRGMVKEYGSPARAAAVSGYGSFSQMAVAMAQERVREQRTEMGAEQSRTLQAKGAATSLPRSASVTLGSANSDLPNPAQHVMTAGSSRIDGASRPEVGHSSSAAKSTDPPGAHSSRHTTRSDSEGGAVQHIASAGRSARDVGRGANQAVAADVAAADASASLAQTQHIKGAELATGQSPDEVGAPNRPSPYGSSLSTANTMPLSSAPLSAVTLSLVTEQAAPGITQPSKTVQSDPGHPSQLVSATSMPVVPTTPVTGTSGEIDSSMVQPSGPSASVLTQLPTATVNASPQTSADVTPQAAVPRSIDPLGVPATPTQAGLHDAGSPPVTRVGEFTRAVTLEPSMIARPSSAAATSAQATSVELQTMPSSAMQASAMPLSVASAEGAGHSLVSAPVPIDARQSAQTEPAMLSPQLASVPPELSVAQTDASVAGAMGAAEPPRGASTGSPDLSVTPSPTAIQLDPSQGTPVLQGAEVHGSIAQISGGMPNPAAAVSQSVMPAAPFDAPLQTPGTTQLNPEVSSASPSIEPPISGAHAPSSGFAPASPALVSEDRAYAEPPQVVSSPSTLPVTSDTAGAPTVQPRQFDEPRVNWAEEQGNSQGSPMIAAQPDASIQASGDTPNANRSSLNAAGLPEVHARASDSQPHQPPHSMNEWSAQVPAAPIQDFISLPPHLGAPGEQAMLPFDFGIGARLTYLSHGDPTHASLWAQTAHSLRMAYGEDYVRALVDRTQTESLSEMQLRSVVERHVADTPSARDVALFWKVTSQAESGSGASIVRRSARNASRR